MAFLMTSFFPTAPASPNAFNMFAQCPRETHATYAELRRVLHPRSHKQRENENQKPTAAKSRSTIRTPSYGTFAMLTASHSPREAHATYHDLRGVFCPSNREQLMADEKSGLLKKGI